MPVEAGVLAAEAAHAGAERVVVGLARAMKNVSFYEVGHPMVREVLAEALRDLNALLDSYPELAVKFMGGYVVIGDRPVMSQKASLGNLIGACHRRQVGSIAFRRGVSLEELEYLVAVLAEGPGSVEEEGGMSGALAARGAQRIVIERLRRRPQGDWQWIHAAALDVLRGAAMGARTGQNIDISSIVVSVRDIVDDLLGERSIVHNLSSMKGMDEYTFIHALHTCILAVELGREIELGRAELEELGICTLLHDVGKIFVPLAILRKPAALSEGEFAVMSRHPVDGAVVLVRESNLPEAAALVAFEHHIHCDQSGYPKVGERRRLHLYSLMTSITDVYDALTTARPYRPPLPPLRAVEVMREEHKGRLEPRLLRHFLRLLGPYPWGSLLRVAEGALAVVTRPNPETPESPFVRRIEAGQEGPLVSEEERPLSELVSGRNQVEMVDPVRVGIDLSAALHGSGGESGEGPA
jgi:hypothetical protein